MALFAGQTPAERNKTIIALALGAVALVFLARMFFGSSSTPTKPTNRKTSLAINKPTTAGAAQNADDNSDQALEVLQPIHLARSSAGAPDAGRNIFAYYVPPPPRDAKASSAQSEAPLPTPTPTPPLTLTAVAPVNVFARSSDFPLEITGDKFTPQARIYIDGQELATRFADAQKVSAIVPAALIGVAGARQVVVRTPDGQLYSNSATLNVLAPPAPPFTYIGILGGQRYNDVAQLKSQTNELLNVRRGDLLVGRFRVTNISERSVEFLDTQLNIKHTLPFVETRSTANGGAPSYQPPRNFPPQPPTSTDDDDN